MKRELRSLTGLRGIAALLVVVGHLHVSGMPLLNLLELQNIAVDLFFVLSVFTLLYVYDAGVADRFRYRSFMVARAARILPMHTVALLAATLLVSYQSNWFSPSHQSWRLDFIRQLFLINCWPGIGNLKQWDLPAWSVSAEVLCYVIFPVWIILGHVFVRASPIVLLAIQGLTMVLSLYVGQFYVHPIDYQWNTIVSPTWGEYAAPAEKAFLGFICGVAVYRCWTQQNIVFEKAIRLCDAIVIAIAAMCVLAFFGFLDRQYIMVLCPLLILGITAGHSVTVRVLASPPLHYLGLISYALYLVHFPIKDAFALFVPSISPTTPAGFVIILACALCVAAASHSLVEKPARLMIRNAFASLGPPQVA